MVKWQPHGQRITGLMIKYPHIKKNAQQFFTVLYPGRNTVLHTQQLCPRSDPAIYV